MLHADHEEMFWSVWNLWLESFRRLWFIWKYDLYEYVFCENDYKLCFPAPFPDIDTDELDSDTKNVEEEVVEFFIKEEITVIE